MKQLDPATGQSTASSPDAGHTGEPADPADETTSALERRRGQRRAEAGEPELPAERRKGDRRRKTPGLPALLGAILAVDEEEQLPEAQE
jgi:hypothetical protein